MASVAFFWHVMKFDGSLTRNINFEVANFEVYVLRLRACFEAPTYLVLIFWLSCGVAVSMGGSCKTLDVRRFHNKLTRRFAWQAWHLQTFSRVCKGVASGFVWQAQYSLQGFQKTNCVFRGKCKLRGKCGVTLHTFPLHFTLYSPHSTLCTLHIALYIPQLTIRTALSTHLTFDI